MGGKTSYASIKKYEDKVYYKVLLRLPKDSKEIIQQAAAERGESVNGLILRLLRQEIPELSEAPRSDR